MAAREILAPNRQAEHRQRNRRWFGETLARSTMPHILLVEDDTAVRLVFLEILFDAGYEVDAAGSYETGSALLDSGAAFDLLVTDRQFLDGSGLALAAQASAMGIPALVVTGDTTGLEQSAYPVLAKPMRPEAFLSAVQTVLASKARGLG